jgi:hypothetical protein
LIVVVDLVALNIIFTESGQCTAERHGIIPAPRERRTCLSGWYF